MEADDNWGRGYQARPRRSAVPHPLATLLRERIERDGPMTFEAWMETCLYHPEHGYYVQGERTGTGDDRDFVTSPTLHEFFGHAIAVDLASNYDDLGCPAAYDVVEFGGGEGDLARDAIQWIDTHRPDLAKALTWTHIEASPAHRGEQQYGTDMRVRWATDMPRIETGAVVSNEFADALPFHWLHYDGSTWQEVCVGHDGSNFVEALRPAPRQALDNAPELPGAEAGDRTVAMPRVRDWVETCAKRVQRGLFFMVDYGGHGRHLWPSETGTVRSYRFHEESDDVLTAPGEVDLTASIDFDLVTGWGVQAGWRFMQLESQEAFLVRNGILEALNQVDRNSVEGASSYLRLRQIMLPTGLGATFKVLRLQK